MTKLRHAILSSIKAAGIISAGLLVPKVTATFIEISNRRTERVTGALSRLRENGLVELKGGHFRLTAEGQRRMSALQPPARPRTWDGQWRIIIFDVPEAKRAQRALLRRSLIEIGFLRLQDSVWIYPFDCEDLVSMLKLDFTLGKEVLYIIANSLENDLSLRRHFDITK